LVLRPTIAALMLCGLAATARANTATLQARLDQARDGDEIRLPAGEIAGPVVIRRAVRLIGAGRQKTRIQAVNGIAITVEAANVDLRDLTVEGQTGVLLRTKGQLRLDGIAINSGGTAVAVYEGGTLNVHASTLTGHGVPTSTCDAVLLVQGGTLNASALQVAGACVRGVELHDSTAEVTGLTATGATRTAFEAVDSKVRLSDSRLTVQNHDYAAVFAAHSTVQGSKLDIDGGLQGVLLRGGEAEFNGMHVRDSTGAGVSLVAASSLVLRNTVLAGPFRQAALFLAQGSRANAEHLDIQRAGVAGVLAIRSSYSQTGGTVSGARPDDGGDFGHGIIFERSSGVIEGVVLTDCAGSAIYASHSESSVRVDHLQASSVQAVVAAVDGAHVTVLNSTATASEVGLYATGRSVVAVESSLIHTHVGVSTCDEGRVLVGSAVTLDAGLQRSRCPGDPQSVASPGQAADSP
jgi:hypothetical protein